MTTIPFELQELVIDLVHDQGYGILTATLRSCALTCRAWLPRSRRRLYHRLELQFIQPTQLNKLMTLLNGDPEVSKAVRELQTDDASEEKDTVHTGAILVVLAGKLPHLTSLTLIDPPIHSSPARLKVLASFPTLTTLELYFITFPSYVAFQRMLAAAPALRRLSVSDVTWISTHTSPNIQYDILRFPPLTHLAWYDYSSSEKDSIICSYLIQNVHLRGSLEYLHLRALTGSLIDHVLPSVATSKHLNSSSLRKLSTLRLGLPFGPADPDLSSVLGSSVRLIAAFLSSEIDARRPRTFELGLVYERGTLVPVAATPGTTRTSPHTTQDVLELLLDTLETHRAELGAQVSRVVPDGGWLSSVSFVFRDRADMRSFSKGGIRLFIGSLRSRVEGIVPDLHRRGRMSVKFRSSDSRGVLCDWVEDKSGNL